MPPIHHRDPGVIGLLGDPARSPYYGIIVDGLHSHPNTVRIAYGAKKDGCILVTDGQSRTLVSSHPKLTVQLNHQWTQISLMASINGVHDPERHSGKKVTQSTSVELRH